METISTIIFKTILSNGKNAKRNLNLNELRWFEDNMKIINKYMIIIIF